MCSSILADIQMLRRNTAPLRADRKPIFYSQQIAPNQKAWTPFDSIPFKSISYLLASTETRRHLPGLCSIDYLDPACSERASSLTPSQRLSLVSLNCSSISLLAPTSRLRSGLSNCPKASFQRRSYPLPLFFLTIQSPTFHLPRIKYRSSTVFPSWYSDAKSILRRNGWTDFRFIKKSTISLHFLVQHLLQMTLARTPVLGESWLIYNPHLDLVSQSPSLEALCKWVVNTSLWIA